MIGFIVSVPDVELITKTEGVTLEKEREICAEDADLEALDQPDPHEGGVLDKPRFRETASASPIAELPAWLKETQNF